MIYKTTYTLTFLQVTARNTVQVEILFNKASEQIVPSLQKIHVHTKMDINQQMPTSVRQKCYVNFLLIYEHVYKNEC